MRRIGLIGGISWGASADYYRNVNLEVNRRLGEHHSADMVMRSLDLQPLLERANDIPAIENVMHQAGADLKAAGASVLGVASFTGHRYLRLLADLGLPLIDLVDAVGKAVREAGYKKLVVWATSYALGDTALMSRLAAAAKADFLLPPESLRPELDRIVFDELASQQLSDASAATLRRLLADQIQQGAQALLLATTDFSPAIARLNLSVPVLDATGIHCVALVDAALA